jgi:peptidoglycan/LPS O-acetylase OafA/YrhL
LDFIFNFFLVPDAPIWGYNFPIWSLKHEWFFYVLYPLLLWLGKTHAVWPILIIMALYISYSIGFRIPFVGAAAYTLSVWSLGGLLAVIYKNYTAIKWIPCCLVIAFIYPFLPKSNQFYPLVDITFGLIVAGGLSILLIYQPSKLTYFLAKFAWLGALSYSIYLLHAPFLNLYQSLIRYFQPNHALPYHLWYVAMSVMVTLPIIYIIYFFYGKISY